MRVPEDVVQRIPRTAASRMGTREWCGTIIIEGVCKMRLKERGPMMVTMTEQEDIGVITSANALELPRLTQSSDVDIYFYDKYVRLDSGFAEKIL